MPGCSGTHYARDMCSKHYQRYLYGQKTVQGVRVIRDRGECAIRDAAGRKHCPSCDLWLPEDSFNSHAKTRDKLQHMCKTCFSSATKQRQYKRSPTDLSRMLEAQDYKCAICGEALQGRYFIDHDHACCPDRKQTCGECIRGLLCGACNLGLGAFKDNVQSLKNAIRYIEREIERMTK